MNIEINELDAISWMLAARHDATVQQAPEFAHAREMVESDSELQKLYRQELEFYDKYDGLLAGVCLSDTQKIRMVGALRATARDLEPAIVPFTMFGKLLAAAALILALLLGGYALFKRDGAPGPGPAMVNISPEHPALWQDMRTFAVKTVLDGFELDHRSPQLASSEAFLAKLNAPNAMGPPTSRDPYAPMGCKVFDYQGCEVSMVCFKTDKAGVVHLFAIKRTVTDCSGLRPGNALQIVNGRSTYSWTNDKYTYVMVAHEEGASLDAIHGIPPAA